MNIYIVVFLVLLLGIFYSFTMSVVRKKKEPLTESFQNSNSNNEKKDDFIPSKKFNGKKNGYVFKTDKKGLGYYLDKFN